MSHIVIGLDRLEKGITLIKRYHTRSVRAFLVYSATSKRRSWRVESGPHVVVLNESPILSGELKAFAIDAITFSKILRELTCNEITITLDGNFVVLSSGSSRFKIANLIASYAPAYSKQEEQSLLLPTHYIAKVSSELVAIAVKLSEVLDKTDFREAMQHIWLRRDKGIVTILSTNGHIMHFGVFTDDAGWLQWNDPNVEQFSLSLQTIDSLKLLLSQKSSDVLVDISTDNIYRFFTQDFVCLTPIAVPRTINWLPFTQLTFAPIATFTIAEIERSKIAMVINDDTKAKFLPGRLTFDTNGTCTVQANSEIKNIKHVFQMSNTQNDAVQLEIQVERVEQKLDIGVNLKYWQKALKGLRDSETSTISMAFHSRDNLLQLKNEHNRQFLIKVATPS